MSKSRRLIHWHKVKGVKAIAAFIIATSGGAGLVPLAPGTMGSLVGIGVAFLIAPLQFHYKLLVWFTLTIVGIWAAKLFDQLMNTEDNQNVVIDEVVGAGISAWTAGTNPVALLIAFVLFRFFDILKPFPVRLVDQWSKLKASNKHSEKAAWWGGVGVMADDVLASFQSLAVILILQYLRVIL